jgi:hypothetical protein
MGCQDLIKLTIALCNYHCFYFANYFLITFVFTCYSDLLILSSSSSLDAELVGVYPETTPGSALGLWVLRGYWTSELTPLSEESETVKPTESIPGGTKTDLRVMSFCCTL